MTNQIMIRRMLRNLCLCTGMPVFRCINIVRWAVFSVMMALLAEAAFAVETTAQSFKVKEEETQLAQRFAFCESVESAFEYSLSTGLRQDNLSWSIANGGVNVASEVNFKKIVIGAK